MALWLLLLRCFPTSGLSSGLHLESGEPYPLCKYRRAPPGEVRLTHFLYLSSLGVNAPPDPGFPVAAWGVEITSPVSRQPLPPRSPACLHPALPGPHPARHPSAREGHRIL